MGRPWIGGFVVLVQAWVTRMLKEQPDRAQLSAISRVCKYEILEDSFCGVRVFWCQGLSNQSDCETTGAGFERLLGFSACFEHWHVVACFGMFWHALVCFMCTWS